MIDDHCLLVQRWRPLFSALEQVRKIAIWVRISNLSIKLYNQKFMWRVGAKLGTLLCIDELTLIHSRGKFDHICVELDLRKKLTPFFTTLGRDFSIKYEVYLVCFRCRKYVHKVDRCYSQKSQEEGALIAMQRD